MADTTNPRGGAAEARNPDYYCTAANDSNDDGRCHNYRLRGLDVCRAHGGATPGSLAKRARHEVAEVAATTLGITQIKPKDFPQVVSELAGHYVDQFADLKRDMDRASLLHAPGTVGHAREFGDMLDRLDKAALHIQALMRTAIQMKTAFQLDDKPPEPPIEKIAAAMRQIGIGMGVLYEDGTPKPHACQCCGQDVQVVRGEAVEQPPEPA